MSDNAEEIRRKRVQRLQALAESQAQQRPRESDGGGTSSSSRPSTPSASISKNSTSAASTASKNSTINTTNSPKRDAPSGEQSIKKEPLPLDQWIENTIADVLRVSLNPTDDKTKDRCVVLEPLRQELQDDGLEPKLTTEILDRVLWSRISEHPCLPSPFDYLWNTWSRVASVLRLLRSKDPNYEQKKEMLDSIQSLCLGYTVLVTTDPDIVGGSNEDTTTGKRLLAKANASPPPWDFIHAVLTRANNDDSLMAFITPIMQTVSQDLAKVEYAGDYKPHFTVLEAITSTKETARAITSLDGFQVGDTPAVQIPEATVLGPFLAVSPLQRTGPLKNFPQPDTLAKPEIGRLSNDIQSEYHVIMKRLFDICNRIVRSSPDARNSLLQYFGKIIDLNHKRKALQTDPKEVSPDGFMLNITYILTKLSEPFADLYGSKIDKVSFEYFKQRQKVFDISEETKINSDQSEADEYYKDAIDVDPNFISHCFYLTIAYHHYGLGGAINSLDTSKRMVDDLKAQIERLQRELPHWRGRGQELQVKMAITRFEEQLKMFGAYKLSLEAVMFDMELQTLFMRFVLFQLIFIVRAADPAHEYPQTTLIKLPFDHEPEYFKYYPEYMLEAPISYTVYLSRNFPHVLIGLPEQELVTFCLTVLRNTGFIKNPYLKNKVIEILFFGSLDLGNQRGMLMNMFDTDPLCLQHLFHGLMNYYIEAEKTGTSSQFHDKFNTRYYISQIIKGIWSNSTYRTRLEQESQNDPEFFVQFVALLLNDATYLLDESLTKLQEIHRLQKELPPTPPSMLGEPEDDETREKRQQLSSAERMCTSFMQLTNQTMSLTQMFTQAVPKAFVTQEIVGRLGAMMNYNLVALVGPKCRELKVQNPEKYGFNPRQLLSSLCDVYLNLAKEQPFIEGVARDGRSYRAANFTRAKDILSRHGLKNADQLESLQSFVEKTEQVRISDEEGEAELGEIPDEFLDPVLFTLMENPVVLPTSKVTVDLSMIKSHLLSDPTDPFNRHPLRLEDCVPNEELKQKIEDFKRQKRQGRGGVKMDIDE